MLSHTGNNYVSCLSEHTLYAADSDLVRRVRTAGRRAQKLSQFAESRREKKTPVAPMRPKLEESLNDDDVQQAG